LGKITKLSYKNKLFLCVAIVVILTYITRKLFYSSKGLSKAKILTTLFEEGTEGWFCSTSKVY
jgi:hypothetical protein